MFIPVHSGPLTPHPQAQGLVHLFGLRCIRDAVRNHGTTLAAHGPYTAAGVASVLGLPVTCVSTAFSTFDGLVVALESAPLPELVRESGPTCVDLATSTLCICTDGAGRNACQAGVGVRGLGPLHGHQLCPPQLQSGVCGKWSVGNGECDPRREYCPL